MDDPNRGALLRPAEAGSEPAPRSASPPAEIAPPATALPSGSFDILFGPNGLRSGWRLLCFLVLAAILDFALGGLWPAGFQKAARLDPLALVYIDGVPFMALFLSAAVMARIEDRSLADYALPLRGAFGSKFWQGTLWGFLALSALLLILRLLRAFDLGAVVMHGTDAVYFAAAWAGAFVVVALFEEFLFRGYPLYTLASGIGFWPAAIVLSLLFGAVHLNNRGENWVGAGAVVAVGLFWCLTVRRTGSLWFAIGLHAMWDYSQSFIYSVPDSGITVPGRLLSSSLHGPAWLTGGAVGPEGSVLFLVILAAMLIAFDRFHREVRYPPAPPKPVNQIVTLQGLGEQAARTKS